MKFKSFLKALFPSGFVFAIGVILCVMSVAVGTLSLLKPAHDYDYVLENGLKEGDHIKGEIYYSLGRLMVESTYLQNKNGSRTPSHVSGYYYAIPAGESGVVGISIGVDDKAVMEALTDETYEFLSNGTPVRSSFSFHGYARVMEGDLEHGFWKGLRDLGYTEDDIGEILADNDGKYLVLIPFDKEIASGGGILILVFGICIMGLGVYLYAHLYKEAKKREEERQKYKEEMQQWTQV